VEEHSSLPGESPLHFLPANFTAQHGIAAVAEPLPERLSRLIPPTPIAIIERMPLDAFTDQELEGRFRDAANSPEREQYIDELFRRNYARVARWCLRFTSDRETAADLAQEVFTRVYQNLGSFQGQSKFSTWLFSIARNHCLNVVQANSRQATELKAEVDENFLSEIPDERETPYTVLERASAAKTVTEILNKSLDDTEKIVFTLHYGEEVPLETITRLLNLQNASGAKAYIVSARRKLARLVQLQRGCEKSA
jgi:RNA polymerase sigma-70 factor (ECF subfamily)